MMNTSVELMKPEGNLSFFLSIPAQKVVIVVTFC